MASPTQWTWVWLISGSWWWTGKPDVLQSMGLQRVRHNCVTELCWSIKLCVCMHAQLCLTLYNHMDCNPPSPFVHKVSQARILELFTISFSKASSWPRNQIQVSPIAGRFFTIWASREGFWYGHRVAQSSPQLIVEHSQHPQRKFYPCLQSHVPSAPSLHQA